MNGLSAQPKWRSVLGVLDCLKWYPIKSNTNAPFIIWFKHFKSKRTQIEEDTGRKWFYVCMIRLKRKTIFTIFTKDKINAFGCYSQSILLTVWSKLVAHFSAKATLKSKANIYNSVRWPSMWTKGAAELGHRTIDAWDSMQGRPIKTKINKPIWYRRKVNVHWRLKPKRWKCWMAKRDFHI